MLILIVSQSYLKVIQTLPMLHMARRDWFDDDEFIEDDGDFKTISSSEATITDTDADSDTTTTTLGTLNDVTNKIVENKNTAASSSSSIDENLLESIKDSVGKMKLVELQQALKKKKLKSSGSKSVLKERLLCALLDEADSNNY